MLLVSLMSFARDSSPVMLYSLYTKFDALSEKHSVFKIEVIG